MKDVVYGVIGGAIGAALWAAVTYFTGYEIGWIAWGVGGIVGFAVALGNSDHSRSPGAAGGLAVIITVMSIVGGKALAVELLMPSDDEIWEMFTANFEDEEYVLSFIADEVAQEFEADGKTLEWPEDSEASAQDDYPVDVWAEAERRWAALGADGQEAFRAEQEAESRQNLEENLPAIRELMTAGGFFSSFAPMDLLFFGLAVTTAYGVGAGKKEEDEEDVVAEEEPAENDYRVG